MEGVDPVCPTQLSLNNNQIVFVIQKYVKDAKQDQHIPDLLDSNMRTTDHVKETLRVILMKTNQFSPKTQQMDRRSTNSGFQLFLCSEKLQFPAEGQHSKRA